MRKSHWIAIFIIATLATARAQQQGRFDVRQFGAVGDSKTVDTDAINKAVDAARAAGGGTVVFHAGTYLSGSIHLQSHVALFIDHGATIEAGPIDRAPCDAPEPNQWDKFQDFGHSHWHNSLIWGENLEDVAIYGTGTIHGTTLNRSANGNSPAGTGNKAIALKHSRNVTVRDITIWHGGHFAILATGVDNFTVDNVKLDTQRDGIDVDACKNVRLSNMTVNSPFDDGICLKSSFGLGIAKPTENVTITNCQVSGYDEGTLIDGSFKRDHKYTRGTTGRIKFGTESSGGFRNITITNCLFDYSRGLAIETVDGGPIEDVTIDNITMRDIVNAPIFIRRGNRARTPGEPPPGVLRRVFISNVVASGVSDGQEILISGIPGYPIEDLRLSNIRIHYVGGGTQADAALDPLEKERDYPEPDMFGRMPSYAFFARHVVGLDVRESDFTFDRPELRPALQLRDVTRVDVENVRTQTPGGGARELLKPIHLAKVVKESF
ncbi:MAG TPA: glycoside hydrolase family 28 protein [Vicinamibacterales bacterium]|nr:glycoside hydrolase family 28 protein [Vicinamibacterales bacterium]